MKIFSIILLLSLCTMLTSCAHGLDPNVDQKIQNSGSIEELKNNQNGMNLELGKLRTDFEGQIQQKGVGNRSNEGIQILQGNGPLFLIFATITLGMVFHYRGESEKSDQAAGLLAKEVSDKNDTELTNRIKSAAKNTPVEDKINKLLKC